MLARIVPPGPFRWALFAMMAAAGCGLIASPHGGPDSAAARSHAARASSSILRAMPAAARKLFFDPACLIRTMAPLHRHPCRRRHVALGASANFGTDAPLAAFLLLAPLITMVTAVPISVGGWGVREGAMVTALGPGAHPARHRADHLDPVRADHAGRRAAGRRARALRSRGPARWREGLTNRRVGRESQATSRSYPPAGRPAAPLSTR